VLSGAEVAHDGLIEGGGVDVEVEEGEGVAAVLEGVEGGAAFALRPLGAPEFGGEEGGSGFAPAFGHEPVSVEG